MVHLRTDGDGGACAYWCVGKRERISISGKKGTFFLGVGEVLTDEGRRLEARLVGSQRGQRVFDWTRLVMTQDQAGPVASAQMFNESTLRG